MVISTSIHTYGRSGGTALNISSKTSKVARPGWSLDETMDSLGDFPPSARQTAPGAVKHDRAGCKGYYGAVAVGRLRGK